MIDYTELTSCLCCGESNLHTFCDLGLQPLANNLKDDVKEEDALFPLQVNVCKNCWHSQLSIAVDREVLYKHYLYVSGTSQTLLKEFDDVVNIITKENPSKGKVLDIACNDGSFLRSFKNHGWEPRGIDPAENIVAKAPEDLNIIADFFPSKKLQEKFDVITCFNVLAHVPNPLQFLTECRMLLTDNGTIYVQTSQKDMIAKGEFDTIYHEHHSFFTINSMRVLAERSGLVLDDVEYRPVHGTSYLFKIRKRPTKTVVLDLSSIVPFQLLGESDLYEMTAYEKFGKLVYEKKKNLLEKIDKSTKKVVGYGAAAKGVVMTNYYAIKHEYLVDENPLKIGRVIGGVNIPIISTDEFAKDSEDLLIVVYAWNFYDEISSKIRKLRPNNNDDIIKSY